MKGEFRRWLVCSSGGESFGLDLRWVRQIDYRPAVLPLPTAEPPLAGLLYWRGRQVPALSLDRLMGRESDGGGQAALMLEVDGRPLGLLVAGVGETLEADEEGLFTVDRDTAGDGLVTQALRRGDQLVFRLNAERLAPAAEVGGGTAGA